LLAVTTVLSLPLAATPRTGNLALVMTGLFLAMFAAAGFLILSVAYATRIYSTSYSGLIAGLGAGAWSAVVACAMPLFGRLFDQQQWQAAFWLAAAAPVAAFAVWVVVNRPGATATRQPTG
jgi:MFS family permease